MSAEQTGGTTHLAFPTTQARGAGTPRAIRLPPEVLERIDRYVAHLEAELHLSVSRSDVLRRLLSLALDIRSRSDPALQ